MDADFRHFNALGPKQQAEAIVEAGCKARGRPVPQLDRPKFDVDESTKLAALIVRAGQRRRGELP